MQKQLITGHPHCGKTTSPPVGIDTPGVAIYTALIDRKSRTASPGGCHEIF